MPYHTQIPLIKHGDTNEGRSPAQDGTLLCLVPFIYCSNATGGQTAWASNMSDKHWQKVSSELSLGHTVPLIKWIHCECPQMLRDILCSFSSRTVYSEKV